MKKINITIGRFQPFTQGHLNMLKDGKNPCIIYKISSSIQDGPIKIKGKLAKRSQIENVIKYVDNGAVGDLTEDEKEILKRPFNNEIVDKELEIVKNSSNVILDVVPVKNLFDALDRFNAFMNEHAGEYEPEFLMCGDDREQEYKDKLDKLVKYETMATEVGSKDVLPNVIYGKLQTNVGSGRQDGLSGTAVRKAIILKDKQMFKKQMLDGTDVMFDEFCDAFDSFIERIRATVNEYHDYKDLQTVILEGGQAKHISHPYDITDFTGDDLIELVDDLFSGKIKHMKEKLDGMNIMATMNEKGDVVFIRNKTNLNSENGGMSILEMSEKWAEKEHQKKVFIQSGRLIESIFKKLGKEYFNPEYGTRKVVNCECIIAGKTNIMPYVKDRVAFHGYKVYKKGDDGKYIEIKDVEGGVDDIYKVASEIDAAQPRPDLVINNIEKAEEFKKTYISKMRELFMDAGLDTSSTLDELKITRFKETKPEWLRDDSTLIGVYRRWFDNDKSYKATQAKKDYPDHYADIMDDKLAKKNVRSVMKPIDKLFLQIGNSVISILDGMVNKSQHAQIVDELRDDVRKTVDMVSKNGTDDSREKMLYQLQRLADLGDEYNSAEGIVITYKGRRLKLTGSFACVNAILGERFKFN